jgi:hypothetical protein
VQRKVTYRHDSRPIKCSNNDVVLGLLLSLPCPALSSGPATLIKNSTMKELWHKHFPQQDNIKWDSFWQVRGCLPVSDTDCHPLAQLVLQCSAKEAGTRARDFT